MRKTFLKVSILGMLTVGMAAGFTSCKDYDDDIDNLQTQIDAIQKDLKEIQDLVSKGVVITNVSQNADGVSITMSNNQTYNIKNGTNGAPGKDADVWTIVKNDKGEYMWAKNGEITEFPAQGPAGSAVAGSYYVPNAETGVFDEYKDGKLVGPTTIPCFAKGGALTAIDNGNTVTISGLVDKDGKELEPVVLAKTGTLTGLQFIPDLYVNGIETMRTEDAAGDLLKTNPASKLTITNVPINAVDASAKGKAEVKDGQIESFTASKAGKDVYAFNGVNTASYILNPNNANLDNVAKWSFLTNDATVEVASRASDAVITVEKAGKNDEGNLEVTYKITDKAKLMPNAKNPGKQTVAALQATLNDDNNTVVSSDFVAVESKTISFEKIQYNQAGLDAKTGWLDAATDIKVTLPASIKNSLKVPYNATFALPEHIKVAFNGGSYTVKQLADRYGLTMNYTILEYTQGTNSTSENKYGSIDATTGVFTPKYVNAQGESVSAVGAEGNTGRSAIGRQPVVILQLKDAEGNLILGGFIKLLIGQEETSNEPINLGEVSVAYTCSDVDFKATAAWDKIAGQLIESTGMTVEQFQQAYEPDGNYVLIDKDGEKEYVKMERNTKPGDDPTVQPGDLGYFDWNKVQGGSQTQSLTLTINNYEMKNWYPKYKDDVLESVGNMTTTPVTKTLYAKFYNKATAHSLYIGYTVTLVGQPTVSYTGKLESQWTTDYKTAPCNPAVAANAKQTPAADATKMTFTTASLWKGGNPTYTADAPYNFTGKGDYALAGTFKTYYTFADEQPNVTGASGTVYALEPSTDGSKLNAYIIPKEPTKENIAAAARQEIASFTATNFVVTNANAYTCDIVNAAPFVVKNPTILFNVDMAMSYGTCNIKVPQVGNFNIGVGRPITVGDQTEKVSVQDGSGDYARTLGTLLTITDWQGNNLWKPTYKPDAKGNPTKEINGYVATEINGVDVFSFWMGETNKVDKGTITFGKEVLTNSTDDVTTATKLADTRKGFKIYYQIGDTKVDEINVSSPADLFPAKMVYANNSGNTVVNDFFVFIPVIAHYTWGDSNIGYATVKITSTQSAN